MNRSIHFLLVFVLFLIVSNTTFAAPGKIVYSIANGDFYTSGNWSTSNGGASCGCVPDESKDEIHIMHNVTSAVGIDFGSSVQVYLTNNSTLTITGNTQFFNNSIIEVSNGSTLSVIGDLTNKNNSNEIVANGTISVTGNFSGGNGSAITGSGYVNVSGNVTLTGTGSIFGSHASCTSGGSGCNYSASVVAPIELLSFDGSTENGDDVSLKWTTATETNNDYFEIERSNDAESFLVVATVKGAGNSSSVLNYQHLDKTENGIVYYRLKQTDFDGKFSYSEVISVKKGLFEKYDLDVFPNPSDGENISIVTTGYDNVKDLTSEIYNSIGTLVFSKKIELKDGLIKELKSSEKLSPGIYFIVLSSQKHYSRKKLIVQ